MKVKAQHNKGEGEEKRAVHGCVWQSGGSNGGNVGELACSLGAAAKVACM